MDRLKKQIELLLLLAGMAFVFPACESVLDLNDDECEYTVQIRYDYNRENTSETNLLTEFVHSIDEYIFDEQGILYAVNSVAPDVCDGVWRSEYSLPPGRYSLIAYGNRTGVNSVNEAVIGKTTRDEMLLTPDNPYVGLSDGTQTHGDRLYHAYRTFTVAPTGASLIRADMTHAHFGLWFRIRWKNTSRAPANTEDFYTVMNDVPSQYSFMPEYIERDFVTQKHDCDNDDEYNTICQKSIHHIPMVHQEGCEKLAHRSDVRMNVGKQFNGYFIAYRVRNETPLTMSFHGNNNQIFTVDLQRQFFETYGIELDRNLRQEFAIEIIVDENGGTTVQEMDIANWDEGGSIW